MTITPGQNAITRLFAAGLPQLEIARRLGISQSSVSTQISRTYRRLGVRGRRELAIALQACSVVANRGGRPSNIGLERGEPVRLNGGRYEGFHGTYDGRANSRQVYIRIGGGRFALKREFVEGMVK